MPNFNFDVVDNAHDHHRHHRNSSASASSSSPPPSRAQKRLESLKQRIADELLAERRLREIEQSKPKLDPLSLAPQNESKKPRQTTALDHSFHVLAQSLKLDGWVQRELQSEIDRKSQEMETLQSQNDRLREIITLRQEANHRREEVLQDELDRLRAVTRRAAPPDLTSAMDELREMKELVNAGAETLYDTLKQRAVSERLALVRTFTVRIREIQNLIEKQREENTDGAQEWIDRYGMLEQEHDVTSNETDQLRHEVIALQSDVENFEDVSNTRKHRFEELIDELSSLKADNNRLAEHSSHIQRQIIESKARNEEFEKQLEENKENSRSHHNRSKGTNNNSNNRPQSAMSAGVGSNSSGTTSPAVSRPTSALPNSNNINNNRPPRAPSGANNANNNNNAHHQTAGLSQREEAEREKRGDRQYHHNHQVNFTSASQEEKAATALRRLRGTLDGMKKKIRHVRATHIEHLQERTELELFLRQCVDDVRRDLERASSTDAHLRFSPEEKQRVVDILSAKLRVLTALHKRTFPNKLSPAMDVNFPVDVVMGIHQQNNSDATATGANRSRSNSPPERTNGSNPVSSPTMVNNVMNRESLNTQQRPSSTVNTNVNTNVNLRRSITPLQQQANYQLPHRSSGRSNDRVISNSTKQMLLQQQQSADRQRNINNNSKPPRATSSSSSSRQQQNNNNNTSHQHQYNHLVASPQAMTNVSYAHQSQDHQQQDELMDSLWTKWQDWNSKIATKSSSSPASSSKKRK